MLKHSKLNIFIFVISEVLSLDIANACTILVPHVMIKTILILVWRASGVF